MKKYFSLVAFSIVSIAIFAQQPMVGNQGSDNWSIGINAGGITPFKHSAFFPNLRSAYGLEINKQLTPVVGLGLEGMSYVNTSFSRTVFDMTNVSLLGKINLNNLFAGYSGTPRPFELEAVGGLGWLHGYMNGPGDWDDLSSKVGLNLNFNLGESKKWTFALKPALVYNLQGERPAYDGVRFNANSAAVEIAAGLIYHFKNSNDKHHMSYARAYNQAEIDGLNSRINKLQSDLQNQTNLTNQANQTIQVKETSLDAANRKVGELQKALDECLSQGPKIVTNTKARMESYVTFRQGRTTIDASQQPNVERIAIYLKNHPKSTVAIKGYASPEGSQEVNERIAKQRAQVVKDMLVSKFGIAAGRITAEGQGVGNLFSEPDWNRVSICTIAEEK